jgi:hypothetical protein
MIENNIKILQDSFDSLVEIIGEIPIGKIEQFPYGWRKSAKGRTVWRILEEIIVQNLEKHYLELNLREVTPATSEVGVYDLTVKYNGYTEHLYINIKSAVKGGRINKDDLSKAKSLIQFFDDDISRQLFIATFVIDFTNRMTIKLDKIYVLPITWIPDIYVNPSNNGNLQSSKYKDIETAVKRTNVEFLNELKQEIQVAENKKLNKIH